MKTCSLLLSVLCCITSATRVGAQSSVVTYQGRVQSGGDDFDGNGQFKFALVTVTNNNRTATATAAVTSGFVTSVAVNSGGNGYVSAPTVTISGGGGSGATATASIGGGSVTGIIVNNPGSGYVTVPVVAVAPPPEALTYTTYWSNDGTSVNGSEPAAAVNAGVAGGLFTVRLGDSTLANMMAFPAGLFQRPNLHLRLWFNNGVSGFAVLNPAQPLTAAPYAFVAGGASNLLGTLGSSQLSGAYANALTFLNPANSFSGNGAGLTALNAANLASGTVPEARLSANVSLLGQTIEGAEITDGTIGSADINAASFNTTFWRTSGNAGTTPGTHFLGTTDGQALELKVNGLRALRVEPNGTSPNMIGGFNGNLIRAGDFGSTIGGGGSLNNSNAIFADYATVAGGANNEIGTNANYSAISGGNNNNVAADSSYSAIGGGSGNTIAVGASDATIAGGQSNDISTNSFESTISGGFNNNIASFSGFAVIAGGQGNDIGANSDNSAIGGGNDNNIAADSPYVAITGGQFNNVGTNSDYSAVGGGNGNRIAANSSSATIAGGSSNDVGTNSPSSTIGGGSNNNIAGNASAAAIAGGSSNDIGGNSDSSAIGGGNNNNIADNSANTTIAGGLSNDIGTNSPSSAIGGGSNNNIGANAPYATIPGGSDNEANGDYSFAAGRRAKAINTGSFVWADSQNTDFDGGNPDSVSFRCAGGVRFTSGLGHTVSWLPGLLSWSFSSDRNLKEGLISVNTREVLDKVSRLPMSEWSFKGHPQRHIGPMAQDFHALFPLNENDKMIDSGDLQGVALAAIQGLNEKVEVKNQKSEVRIQKLEAENEELKRELADLKSRMNSIHQQLNGGAK